jgi:hypothetical protein
VFGASTDQIDAPARHSHINASRSCAHITATTEKPIAGSASKRMVRFIAAPI